MTNEELLNDYVKHCSCSGVSKTSRAKAVELRAELLRRLGAAVSAPPQPRPWFPIETAPRNGRHIQAADFTPGATGFGGDPQQAFQCVVHWWEWCDGTHQEEWGWYPSTGAGESNALTNLTHWRPLDGFFAAAPAQEPQESLVGKIVHVNNPRFSGYGFAQYDSGDRSRVIGVVLENGNTWEYEIETVRAALPKEISKAPKAVQARLNPAQEQPVAPIPACPKCELPTKPMYGDEPPSEWDHHCPQKGKP